MQKNVEDSVAAEMENLQITIVQSLASLVPEARILQQLDIAGLERPAAREMIRIGRSCMLRFRASPAARRSISAEAQMLLEGGMLLLAGALVTAASYSLAGPGEAFKVMTGAMLCGIVKMGRGLAGCAVDRCSVPKDTSLRIDRATAIELIRQSRQHRSDRREMPRPARAGVA